MNNQVTDTPESIVVEFFGLPASGKSTLCGNLEERLAGEGVPTSNITLEVINCKGTYEGYVYMIGYALTTMVRFPGTSLRLGRLIRSTNQRSVEDMIRIWLYSLFIHALFRRFTDERGVHLFDQGIYQILWSTALTGDSIDMKTLRLILDEFPTPQNHLVVLVDVDIEVSLKRLAEREGNFTRLESLLKNERDNGRVVCVQEHRRVCELLMEEAQSESPSTISVNTKKNSVEEAIKNIYNQIVLVDR